MIPAVKLLTVDLHRVRLPLVRPFRTSFGEQTVREVLVVRADEAHHRDVNHGFANGLGGLFVDHSKVAPSPYHDTDLKKAA